jgi:hypothetical protein
MSMTTAVSEKIEDGGKLTLSETPTARNSIENTAADAEKQAQDAPNDDPPPLPRVRLVLLLIGLCLAMFLVALDFVCSLRSSG